MSQHQTNFQTRIALSLIPLLTLSCLSNASAPTGPRPQVYYRSAIIVKRTDPHNSAGILRLDFSQYGTNVTEVVLDTNSIVHSRNAKQLPLVLFSKITQEVDTIGYVYAKKTPTWVAKVIQAAADSTQRYALLAPQSVVVAKGKYVRVVR